MTSKWHTESLVNDTMRSMLENTRDFMFVKNKDYIYVGSSEAFAVDCARQTGIEDVLGKTDYEIFEDTSYADKYRKDDERLLITGDASIEYREPYPGKDGEMRYCLTTKYLIRDEDGNPAGIFGQCRDITEQVRLEHSDDRQQTLLEQSSKIFLAMQNVYEVVLYFDFEKDYYFHAIGANNANETIKERGRLSELVPIWLKTDMSAESREANKKFFDISTMPQRLTEHGMLTRELETFHFGWVRISLLPVDCDSEGNVISCLWVCEPIGDEIATRVSLRNKNEILEALRNVYDICMYWNLTDDTYFRVYGESNGVDGLVPDEGRLSEILPIWLQNDMNEGNRKLCEPFYNLDTLGQRLKVNDILRIEVETIHSGWMRTSLVPAAFDKQGNVTACLWVGEIIDKQKKKEFAYNKAIEEATIVAETDTLTGLLNRGGSEARVFSAIEKRMPGLYCLMDADDFKHINDRYGHVAGDFVLQRIAECMKSVFAGADILGRFGGDEFVVFTSAIATAGEAQEILDRFVLELETDTHEVIGGEHIHVTIGAFFYDGLEAIEFGSIYSKCDAAMYSCKELADVPYQLVASGSDLPISGKRDRAYDKRSLEGLLENVPGGVVMYEWDGKYMRTLYVSRFYKERYEGGLFGELDNKDGVLDYSRFHPDDKAGFLMAMTQAISGPHKVKRVCRVWNENLGGYERIEMNAVAKMQPGGRALVYALFSEVPDCKETTD